MAVSENDLIVGPLTPAAGVTTISLDFYFEQESWLEVYKSGSETPLVLGADYTVAGAGTTSGVVTLTTPANGTDAYSVYLVVPLQRSSDMQLRGEFKSEPFNIEMDRIWQALQGQRADRSRALVVSKTSIPVGPLTPVPNRLLGINSAGNLDTFEFSPFSSDVSAVIRYDTVAALKASSEAARGNGSVWEAGGFRYQEDSTATQGYIANAAGVKLKVLPGNKGVSAAAFGMPTGGDDTTLMNRLMFSDAKVIHFPPGVYRAYVNNLTSNRTFYFGEGAIIDGVFHAYQGSGPETGAGFITLVENVRVVGTCASTVRVGGYYGANINFDKIRITEVDAAYVNQSAEGGSKGVHFSYGTKDLKVDEIVCDSATAATYALAVDRSVQTGADHLPTDIYIGKLTIRNCTQSAIRTLSSVRLRIDEVVIDSYDTYDGCAFTGDTDLYIGRITLDGGNPLATKDGIYVLNGVSAYFGDVNVTGASQIGFRTFNCGRVDAGRIRASGNALDQVRIESPGSIGEIITGGAGTGVGLLLQGACDGLFIDRVHDDAGGGVKLDQVDDITIQQITTENNGAANGLFLNATNRFTNRLLRTENNDQGLRIINANDTAMGALIVRDNNYGIVGSTLDGWTHEWALYSGNVNYDTNINLETITGNKGKRTRSSVGNDRGDASVTLVVGDDAVTQRFATPLTANRTVTLSTAGVSNGDRFRIVRLASATGASTLTVAGKALAAGQWADVENVGGGWFVAASGAL